MKKKIVCFLMAALLAGFIQVPVQASTPTSNIKKLVNQMNNYESAILGAGNIKSQKTIKLSKANMAKATALSIKVKEENGIEKGEFGDYTTYKITNSQLKKASVNLFGVTLTQKQLSKKRTEGWTLMDAYLLSNGTPVVYYTDAETEIDYIKSGMKIKKIDNKNYNVVQTVYYGYWRYNDGTPNYTISYQVKKNKNSAYGYVITKMVINPLKK